MDSRPVVWMLGVLLAAVWAAGAAAAPPLLRQGAVTIAIDAETGGLGEIRWGNELLARPRPGLIPFDLRQDAQWVIGPGTTPLKLVAVQQVDARQATATVRAGDWQIVVSYRMDDKWPMLTRSARITWQGSQPTKLKGVWFGSPAFAAGKDTYYYSPGVYPPNRFPTDGLRAGTTHGFHHSPAPLIVQLAPRRTALWLTDERTPDSDRPSVTVTEMDGALRVSQGFNALARMRPGESQSVGAACLWLLEGDGQQALGRIHDWMRRHGQLVPADRPEWFRDAVLYSFHPGGTIGSGFRDLGGFAAAMPLLDRIAALGADAIWIMPIEDLSVYHPRDYYKFQEGLGTADEYRALVARAHQLGLHVLQDCVPHGGRNDFPRAKQHPEWLVYDEDGSTLSYWCFDFNWPTWRQYMAGVARHYVSQFAVDGYRVDAVSGSKIPNWSPTIPYARASFAQLQGGLNMLRALRSAVKGLKPREGGLLAEVQGSVYGSESDAVYDFTGCYQAFHDVRRLPAEEYVPRLRRWLQEQQYAETPHMLRLRHVESHDSLRGELWYGIEPVRAMMALSAWIHGMPLVYHEMENGHEGALRRIFAIRRQLVELRRGTADYLAVETPPAVFACLRADDRHASVVLINLCDEPVDTAAAVPLAALPPALRRAPVIVALRPEGQQTLHGSVATEKLVLPLRLRPFEYVACALRTETPTLTLDAGTPCAPPRPVVPARLQPTIDPRTGLLDRLCADGQPLIGKVDLYVPALSRQQFSRATCVTRGRETVCRCPVGKSTLELRYAVHDDGLHLGTHWEGEVPRGAALYLPVVDARQWSAATAAGTLAGEYVVRHRPTESATGNIYWRPQGTNVVWDSLQHPLGPLGAPVLSAGGARTLGLGFVGPTPPARVAWLDRLGTEEQLGALVAWNDSQTPGDAPCRELELRLGDSPLPALAQSWPGLRAAAGGWVFENAHYRLRLSRSGVITQLVAKQPAVRTIVERADLYTDVGFSAERIRFAAANEVEAASRIWSDAQGNLRLRFEGRLRGFHRFDLLRPPVEYFTDYTLAAGASFRMTCGVRPQADPRGKSAFLAQIIPVPSVRRATFKAGGRMLSDRAVGTERGRGWQSRTRPTPAAVDEITLSDEREPLVHLTELRGGALPLCNVFTQAENLFLAWFDGPFQPGHARQWRWTSAVWTVGRETPQPVGETPAIAGPPTQGLLQDGDFEQARTQQPVSLRTGLPLPGSGGASVWQAPPGGRVVAAPVHGGQAAAEVADGSGAYLLWRQALSSAAFAPGTRLRLTAWVKGQSVREGDARWKVGVVRFAAVTDRTVYFSSPALLGTFDWKPTSVEMIVPAGLRELHVEAGLNGASGSLWIDDVELHPLP